MHSQTMTKPPMYFTDGRRHLRLYLYMLMNLPNPVRILFQFLKDTALKPFSSAVGLFLFFTCIQHVNICIPLSKKCSFEAKYKEGMAQDFCTDFLSL